MDPNLAQLARAIEDLNRRIERLEQMIGPRAATADRVRQFPSTDKRSSLESRVGAQYLNRAGVIALLVGVAFFLNWAFVNNWIGPLAVVISGFVGGAVVFLLGEWFLRRRYTIFGFSLQGLGIAAFYLSLWAASEYYRLLLPWAGFAGMLLLTVATSAAAIVRNSEALAIFAAIGGFGTPLLLSTGRNLENELFVYVLILCAGVLLTLRFRSWVGLLVTSFFGAVVVSSVWFAGYYAKTEETPTFIFFCLLLTMFAVAPLLVQQANTARRRSSLLFVMPASALVFLLGTGAVLDDVSFTWTAQVMAALLIFAAWRWCRESRLRASYVLTAIIGSVASIPVAVDGHWATSALWLAYGVVLVVIGFARGLPLIRWTALALLGVTILKVFVYDLSNLGQGYRILALSVLGIALLSLSFLYQRDWLGLRK